MGVGGGVVGGGVVGGGGEGGGTGGECREYDGVGGGSGKDVDRGGRRVCK